MANERYLGLGKEVTYGTEVAATVYRNFVKETFKQENKMEYPMTAAYMEPIFNAPGPFDVKGDITQYATPDEIGEMFLALLGSVSTAQQGATAAYKHTYKPSNTVVSYTNHLDRAGLVLTIMGMTVSKLNIKIVPNAPVMIVATCLGNKTKIGSEGTPTYTAYKKPFIGQNLTATIAGVDETAEIRAIEINIEVDAEDDDYCGDDRFRKSVPKGSYRTTFSADLSFPDEVQMKKFYDGSTGTEPDAEDIATFILNVKLTGLLIESTYYNELEINCPQVTYDSINQNVDARKKVIETIAGEAIRDDTQASAVQVDLTNRIVSY